MSTAPRSLLANAEPWWKGAVIYQIYPRSFADANGDGVGDLPGITQRLDHVASLGVDAIWLSPFFTSPMRDSGYDVADFCGVDPVFGTIADFDALVAKAHRLGLKVLIDQVYSHSSDRHPWFVESRSSRDNAKADWYVWADPKPDGSPPSNWQSVFGGPAWQWDARRTQYYLHNFLVEQPDLNLHHPQVQEAMLGAARFWLERGVDGFRFDALNFAMHDPLLRDNPPLPPTNRARRRSFDFQDKIHNQSHPDIPVFIERLAAEMRSYGATFSMAEVGGDHWAQEMALYTQGAARLDSAYGFNFLYAEALTPALVVDALSVWPDAPDHGWPSWAFENHDAPRAVSRWTAPAHARAFARMKMLLLLSLRGNAILYQGEELGLGQVEIPFDRLVDPEAIANWPITLSRDGVRTPMPWQGDAKDRGFGSIDPWLPHGADHGALAVDQQEADGDSLLHWTRRLIALRRAEPALRSGSSRVVSADKAVLVLERAHPGGATLRCAFNLSDRAVAFAVDGAVLVATGDYSGGILGGYSAVVMRGRA
ncbi:alpha-amylase family glycosyl hydrolase [Sphingomonas sp. S1-29]|uniref:alpha-amylase family glycosyl hydrolase n=1 Tax=Sphingomonas sp. S1-29 TaxID=2991074 RepID=UPI00223FBCC6|nr:alpha-amylase family glycosyl hydrolase [Sphingomonas sp. S1-29]UZK69032.1 alpha-amylase family glycosyl hydrolase [Sphingomonas sp. S1-29]